MVIVNRLAPPAAPVLQRDPGAGTFAAGLDVYIVVTLGSITGETLASVASVLSNTVLNDAVQVKLLDLTDLPGWVQGLVTPYVPWYQNIYAAAVTHGAPAPALSTYQIQASPGLGSGFWTVGSILSGVAPPTFCSAESHLASCRYRRRSRSSIATGAGAFAAGRDVYVLATYTNPSGAAQPYHKLGSSTQH